MSSKKYGKFLTVLLITALIAIIILLCYFIYDVYRKYKFNKKAEEAVDIFQQQILNNNSNIHNNNNTISNDNKNVIEKENNILENNNLEVENNNTNNNDNNNTSGSNKNNNSSYSSNNKNYTSKSKYEGYTMIGTIQIPKIKVKIPILKELSPDALSKASCLIYGTLNEEENAVIIGHNNRNGTFFSNLKKLSSGDIITITDYTGGIINYEVYDLFQTTPDDTSFYQRDTNGAREITLSTCTDNDDTKRIIVFAKEK